MSSYFRRFAYVANRWARVGDTDMFAPRGLGLKMRYGPGPRKSLRFRRRRVAVEGPQRPGRVHADQDTDANQEHGRDPECRKDHNGDEPQGTGEGRRRSPVRSAEDRQDERVDCEAGNENDPSGPHQGEHVCEGYGRAIRIELGPHATHRLAGKLEARAAGGWRFFRMDHAFGSDGGRAVRHLQCPVTVRTRHDLTGHLRVEPDRLTAMRTAQHDFVHGTGTETGRLSSGASSFPREKLYRTEFTGGDPRSGTRAGDQHRS